MTGAMEHLLEYVAERQDLQCAGWTELAQMDGISPEVASFVFDFFDTRGVPFGRVRLDDQLEEDLHLTEVLPLEWDFDFQEAFMDHFGVSRLFRPGPGPDTVRAFLRFVQEELDDWRASRQTSHLA